MCLPTYNIFDELRHCEPGYKYQQNVMVWKQHTIAFFICEDALSSKREDGGRSLYKNDPVEDTFEKYENIDYVISINASPSNIGKFQLRERIFKRICKDHNVHAVYVNQVGSHDEVVYDGQSFIMNPEGKLLWVSEPLKECVDEVVIEHCKPVLMPSINCFKEKLYYEHAILGIKDFFHKQGFKKAVVACSGGIDSAVVLALAVDALGPENVEAITMPSKVSSAGSVDDSKTLCDNLGVNLYKFPIFTINDQFVDTYSNWLGALNGPVTKQNIQPKIRTMCAMAFSNENGHLFLNSSNKTELTFGYGTMYGDLGGAVSPLGDIWKDDVFALARYINKIKNREVIPVAIIDKIPSAELEVGQIDENDLGSYEVANAVGRLFIEQSMLSEEEKIICQITLKEKSNKEAVEKLIRRIDRNEHKRQQFGVIIRMRGKAFGMGRKMPIVQRHDNRNHPLLDLF
jgi:NAD+ synthetase